MKWTIKINWTEDFPQFSNLPYNKLSHWFWWSDSTYSLAWLGTDRIPSSKPKPKGLFRATAEALVDPDAPICDDNDLLTRTCCGEAMTAFMLSVKLRWGEEAAAIFWQDLAGLGNIPPGVCLPLPLVIPDE